MVQIQPKAPTVGPLVVAGTVRGRRVQAMVRALPDVLTIIARWTDDDPDAIGCWGLREDHRGPLTLPVRRKAGLVQEIRRIAHLVRLVPGEPHGGVVAALCGERLPILEIDTVTLGVGMPCTACLTYTAVTTHIDGAAIDEHPDVAFG